MRKTIKSGLRLMITFTFTGIASIRETTEPDPVSQTNSNNTTLVSAVTATTTKQSDGASLRIKQFNGTDSDPPPYRVYLVALILMSRADDAIGYIFIGCSSDSEPCYINVTNTPEGASFPLKVLPLGCVTQNLTYQTPVASGKVMTTQLKTRQRIIVTGAIQAGETRFGDVFSSYCLNDKDIFFTLTMGTDPYFGVILASNDMTVVEIHTVNTLGQNFIYRYSLNVTTGYFFVKGDPVGVPIKGAYIEANYPISVYVGHDVIQVALPPKRHWAANFVVPGLGKDTEYSLYFVTREIQATVTMLSAGKMTRKFSIPVYDKGGFVSYKVTMRESVEITSDGAITVQMSYEDGTCGTSIFSLLVPTNAWTTVPYSDDSERFSRRGLTIVIRRSGIHNITVNGKRLSSLSTKDGNSLSWNSIGDSSVYIWHDLNHTQTAYVATLTNEPFAIYMWGTSKYGGYYGDAGMDGEYNSVAPSRIDRTIQCKCEMCPRQNVLPKKIIMMYWLLGGLDLYGIVSMAALIYLWCRWRRRRNTDDDSESEIEESSSSESYENTKTDSFEPVQPRTAVTMSFKRPSAGRPSAAK